MRRCVLRPVAGRGLQPETHPVEPLPMTRRIDLDRWPRRAAFEFFRGYDNPYFNVCVPIDATDLVRLSRSEKSISFSLASLYLALRVANDCEPFRYRLQDSGVLVHDRIHAGTTHLLPDQRLAFVYFDYADTFERFREDAEMAKQSVEVDAAVMDGQEHRTDLIHFSSLPWLSFTSFSNARNWGTDDSIPKITFGKYFQDGDRLRMPVSIEVHHALMDGVHVGEYVERLEAALADSAAIFNRLP